MDHGGKRTPTGAFTSFTTAQPHIPAPTPRTPTLSGSTCDGDCYIHTHAHPPCTDVSNHVPPLGLGRSPRRTPLGSAPGGACQSSHHPPEPHSRRTHSKQPLLKKGGQQQGGRGHVAEACSPKNPRAACGPTCLTANAQPTSNSDPFSVQDSWHRYPTRGVTCSGSRRARMSSGITVAVRREAAMGAIVFTRTLRFLPAARASGEGGVGGGGGGGEPGEPGEPDRHGVPRAQGDERGVSREGGGGERGGGGKDATQRAPRRHPGTGTARAKHPCTATGFTHPPAQARWPAQPPRASWLHSWPGQSCRRCPRRKLP